MACAIHEKATGAGEHVWEPAEMEVIRLAGPVGTTGFCMQKVQALPAGPVHIHIDSGGGDITHAIAIYNLLLDHNAPITCTVARAGSASVICAMAADTRIIRNDGFVFLHCCIGAAIGSSRDLVEAAQTMDLQDKTYAEIVAARTGLDVDKVLALMEAETTLSAQEAVDFGFASAITGPPAPITRIAYQPMKAALGTLEYGQRMAQPERIVSRAEALPVAMQHPGAGAFLEPRATPKIQADQAGQALMQFTEGQRRAQEIKTRLAHRLQRAIDCGGQVRFPVRVTWTCANCGASNFHHPARYQLATPCAECGASTPKE